MLEMLSFVEDEHPLLSRLSFEVYPEFAESAKPPQRVADLSETDVGGAISVDSIRRGYHALTDNDACDVPVFCPADTPALGRPQSWQITPG